MKYSIEGVGVAVEDWEEDYLRLGDDWIGISELFKRAHAETLENGLEFIFDAPDYEPAGEETHRVCVEKYRSEKGRQYPPVYRVKLSIELEEVSADEAEAYWKKRAER